jgi:GNAT superfamily N-acetyltransferase
MNGNGSNHPRFRVEPATPEDQDAVDELWGTWPSRPEPSSRRRGCLVARGEESGTILGVAEYTRTFPPEDGVMSVMVAGSARHHGIGSALLRALAMAAMRNGIRNLGVFLRFGDEPGWRLLAAVGIPVRVYAVRGGAFIEMDLIHLMRNAVDRSMAASGNGRNTTDVGYAAQSTYATTVAHRASIGAVVDKPLATPRT